MRKAVLAAMAALALAACGQGGGGSGPALPKTQAGAQAPSVQTPPTSGVQQGNVTNEVRQQLIQQIGDLLGQVDNQFGGGMARAQGTVDEVAPMQPGTDHRWRVTLTGGTAYRVLGACDGDCTNVDIELIDMTTGGVVASDMLPDDYPVVDYTPAANGDYIVRVLMQTCTVAPCYGGARLLSAQAATK